jgi:hypothetical protein
MQEEVISPLAISRRPDCSIHNIQEYPIYHLPFLQPLFQVPPPGDQEGDYKKTNRVNKPDETEGNGK